MIEEWKDIRGYEGFYQISSLGHVRNLAIYSFKYNRVIQRKYPRFLRQETTRDGYKRVVLSLYGKKKKYSVHRLVASAFIDNPNNYPEVNHKDECTDNNRVENLEWCTAKFNSNYGTLPQRIKERLLKNHPTAKVVNQYDMDGRLLNTYPSARKASEDFNVSPSMIERACRGQAKTAAGYRWSYA